MDKQQINNRSDMRSLVLTVIFCVIAVAAAVDLEYGTRLIGHALFMILIGILSVIFITCEKSVAVLDAAALLVIVFFTSNADLVFSALGLVLILSAVLLVYAIRKKSEKTSAVLVVSLTVAIGYLTVIALFYSAKGNSLEISALFSKLNGFFDSIKVSCADMIRQFWDSVPEEVLAYYTEQEITKEMLVEAYLTVMEDYVDWVQLLLPGCFIFLVQVMGYIGVLSFEKTARWTRFEEALPKMHWHLYHTQISCVIYILVTIVYIITSFFAPSSSFAVIITNFWIALMPVMIACGFHSLRLRYKTPCLR